MKENKKKTKLTQLYSDQPLTAPTQDKLGRSAFAEQMANAIMYRQASSGFVFGLYGEWGTGKTSTINFIQYYIEQMATDNDKKPIIIKFNPWWFADKDQLLIQFFNAIKHKLPKKDDQGARLSRLSDYIDTFSLALSTLQYVPVSVVSLPAKAASAALKNAGESVKKTAGMMQADVQKTREKICKYIEALDRKMIIIIDDIERLPGDEIRQILRLVNSVANFPNTIYLLSFDRKRVVEALGQYGSDYGEDFLEKIVQVAQELPMPNRHSLLGMLGKEIEKIIIDAPSDLADEHYIFNVFSAGVAPFIRTPRQCNRYLNTLAVSYPVVNEHVNVADFLAITALKVFCPDFYSALRDNYSLFCWIPPRSTHEALFVKNSKEEREKQRRTLIDNTIKDSTDRVIVENTLSLLFPELVGTADRKWSKQRRLCHNEVFPMYFKMSLEHGEISNPEIKSYLAIASDQKELEIVLLRLANDNNLTTGHSRFYHLLSRMEEFTARDIEENKIQPIIKALYNVGDKCLRPQDESAGIMGMMSADFMITLIIHQLAKRISDRDKRFELIEKAMRESESVYIVVCDVAGLAQQQGGDGRESDREEEFLVTREQLQVLKNIAVSKIESVADNLQFFKHPRPIALLYRWREWGVAEKANAFLNNFISCDDNLFLFLTFFVRNVVKNDEYGRSTSSSKSIILQELSDFVVVEQLLSRCEQILKDSPEWLTAEQKEIVELIRKAKRNPNNLPYIDADD